jgi:hypothetical protein
MMSCSKNYNTKYKGDAIEAVLMSELLLRGYSISIPFGDDNRYDLIVEGESEKLYKVQIKYVGEMRSPNTFQISRIKRYFDKIDILAILVIDTWYFFDNKFIKSKSNNLHLNINLKKDLSINKENFDVFV